MTFKLGACLRCDAKETPLAMILKGEGLCLPCLSQAERDAWADLEEERERWRQLAERKYPGATQPAPSLPSGSDEPRSAASDPRRRN